MGSFADYRGTHGIDSWARELLADPDMALMGHAQRAGDANLGLGWVYYGLARAMRPRRVVVIGSWRGFVPLVFGRALADNLEGGEVVFIDPSLVDGFWSSPQSVAAHFLRFGVANVRHHRATTQEFVASPAFEAIADVGILFIDGLHTAEQARFDYEAFRDRLAPGALVLFHDTLRVRTSRIYGEDKAYEHRVKDFVASLRADPALEVLSLPLGDGLTLLRRKGEA
jgi:predicted O-methyltransferase YrrM